MDPHDETSPKPRRPQVQIPPDVERRLRQAISEHLRTYRNKHYERLREHPEFRPYIGLHLGETGRKRLNRLVAEVRAAAPSTRHKPPTMSAAERPPEEQPASPASLPVITSPEAFAGAGHVLVGYGQLQQLVQRRLPELEQAIAACKNEFGEIIDPRAYRGFLQDQRATVDMVAKLADRFQAQLNSARFVGGLMGLIEHALVDAPERWANLQDQIRKLAAECGGLVPS